MQLKNVLFTSLGKWSFEKYNNLFVYYAGCRKSVIEFIKITIFLIKTLKKDFPKAIIFSQQ